MSNIKIEVRVGTCYVGSTVTEIYDTGYTPEEWEDLTGEERERVRQEIEDDHVANHAEVSSKVLDQ